ncbi:LutC/YkgG family protein [Brevibacillus fulvus]|uniref:L-lactate dehydrogenase complex protein LldG n=1 Tax=Brevibacillus fulvus TaxID=1125967 RepID=A0A938XUP3_9BACL|nr:LUD domain-containing protein [Brevibacillus fulvus]MBM7590437.1 L-lactate dehydrogenase complex protein LldG [Brevibacillus fulvus]
MTPDFRTSAPSKMESETETRQQAFLQNIANRLGRAVLQEKPLHPDKGAPRFWQEYRLDQQARIELFCDNWQKAGGIVHHFPHEREARQFLVQSVLDSGARKILRQDQPELAEWKLEESLREGQKLVCWQAMERTQALAEAAEAKIGIVVADYAVACTGSVVVASSAQKGRSVSLLPPTLFVIVPLDRLKTRLGEVLTVFENRARSFYPAGIHIISGPSRSADIENDLTIGVHGPGKVYALLFG